MKRIYTLAITIYISLATNVFGQNMSLSTAVVQHKSDVVKTLIEQGANPNELVDESTLLSIAIRNQDIESFRILVNHPKVDINCMYTQVERGNAVYRTKKTVIIDALQSGNAEMIQTLLDKGAKVDYCSTMWEYTSSTKIRCFDNTPLLQASKLPYTDKNKEFMRRIADQTMDLDRALYIDQFSMTNLMKSLVSNQEHRYNDILISMMDRGANINYTDYPNKALYAAYDNVPKDHNVNWL